MQQIRFVLVKLRMKLRCAYFHHDIGVAPQGFAVGYDRCAGRLEAFVGETRGVARLCFDADLKTECNEFLDDFRGGRNPAFVRMHLTGYCNSHVITPGPLAGRRTRAGFRRGSDVVGLVGFPAARCAARDCSGRVAARRLLASGAGREKYSPGSPTEILHEPRLERVSVAKAPGEVRFPVAPPGLTE